MKIVLAWVVGAFVVGVLVAANWNHEHSFGILVVWSIWLSGLAVGLVHRAFDNHRNSSDAAGGNDA